ncbi:MAG TPA: PAS domain S-box protein [Anaerolineae bacterium]|nr:PAS domain S-box protein [Anaerolineae bacterium]
MSRFAFSSLSVRLLLLVLLAVVPLLILILYNAEEQRNSAANQAQADALRVTRIAASNQVQFIEQARQLLVSLAQLSEVRQGEPPPCNTVYSYLQAQYLQQSPRYLNFGLIDPQGNIYCSVQPVNGPVNVVDRPYFSRAVLTLNFSLGDYEYNRVTGQALLNFGYPVLDFNGRARVVIFATLDLAWLGQLASQAQLPQGSTFTVIDRRGAILLDYPTGEQRIGQTLEAPIIQAVLARQGAEGATEALDAGGVQRLYAFSPLGSPTGDVRAAYVVIGVPAEVAFAEGNRILTRTLIGLGTVTLLALAVTWVAGQWFILRPVYALVQATHRLSAGDLSARTGLPSVGAQGELNQLAHAFDRMAAALQQRQTERDQAEYALRKSEELYRTLARNFPNGAVILFDPDLRYTIADGAGLAEVGLSKELLEGKTLWEIFSPETSALLEPQYRAALAGTSNVFEAQFADRIYLIHTLPLRNERDEIFAGMTMTQDITESKRAEAQLREKEQEYRGIFEATSDGLVINDLDGFVVEANPAFCAMHGYTPEEMIGRHPATFIHPDYRSVFAEYMQAIKAGGHFEAQAVDLRKDGTPFHVEVRGVGFWYRGKPHTLGVVRDITERKRAEQELQEREAQYRSIFESSIDGLFINDLDGQLVDFNAAAAHMHGYTPEEFRQLQPPDFIHADSLPLFKEYMDTVRAGDPFRARAVDRRKDGSLFHVEVFGAGFTYRQRPHALAIVRDITEEVQAQQLLEQRVMERTRELSTLLDISHNVASTLELKPLLGLILDQLHIVMEYSGATIFTLQQDELTILHYRGPITPAHAAQLRFPLAQAGANRAVIERKTPVIIDDVRGDFPLARAFQETAGDELETTYEYIRSWMGVPLMIKDWVIGMLSLDHHEPNHYTARHANLALAIASQAAIAIENARLYEQAQNLAALEERQKLARELHDSVSQALYGIALGARTARTLLDRDPSKVADPLDYVLSLAEAGLAEMRALIFELRPESLETEGLTAALTKQVASLRARHGIEVGTAFCDEPSLPLEVKTALYRIAQEALHNTVKHARATQVMLRVDCLKESGLIVLEIKDNGRGFDTQDSFPGHLGLHSMRERAEKVGGQFEVESSPGAGTRVWVRVRAS